MACVELPDDAAGVVIQLFCDGVVREAGVIVSDRPDSHAARIGELLGLPVHKRVTREALVHCDYVVVGDPSPQLWTSISQLTAGLAVELLPLDQVLELAGEGLAESNMPSPSRIEEPTLEASSEWPQPEVVISPTDVEHERAPAIADSDPEIPVVIASEGPVDPGPIEVNPRPSDPEPFEETAFEPAPSEPEAAMESPTRGNVSSEALAPKSTADEPIGTGTPFHAGTILGGAAGAAVGTLWIDPEEPRIRQVLDDVLTATGARTASLMLLDVDGGHLRPLAAHGRGADAILESRPRFDRGLVGRVFGAKAPEIHHGTTPCLAEQEDLTHHWLAAGHPLVVDGSAIGVLSINGEFTQPPDDAEIFRILRGRSADASAAVLSAVRIDRIETEPSQIALQCLVDRLMAVEEALPARLVLVAEALRKALAADYVHAYMVDALRGSLVPVTSAEGSLGARKRELPIARGMLGWVVRHGAPHAIELCGKDETDRALTVCYPVASTHPHSLLFIENIPLRSLGRDAVLRLLGEIVEQVEGMIAVEEAMSLQDLVADLDMRIADHSAELSHLPPELKTQALLELALDLTTAEAAVWQPRADAQPTMSRPGTRRSAATLLEAWNQLETVTAQVRAAGATAAGFQGEGWEQQSTPCSVPFVGVRDGDQEGVLIVFYSPSELMGAPAQVPLHVLWKALRSLCERIPREDRPVPESGFPTAARHGEESGWLVRARFAEAVRYEQTRSRRSGRPFAVTAVRIEGQHGQAPARALRRMLAAVRGEIDLLCEVGPGRIVLLWPELPRPAGELLADLERHWQMAQPNVPLACRQVVLAGESDDPEQWLGWLNDAPVDAGEAFGATSLRPAA